MVGGAVLPQRVSTQLSLINGNLQGKYMLWAHFSNFQTEDCSEFSTLDRISLRKLTRNIFGGSGSKI